MSGPEFQEKIKKLTKRAGWEYEDVADFMADFIRNGKLEKPFLAALEEEIEELDKLAGEIDDVLDEDDEKEEEEDE